MKHAQNTDLHVYPLEETKCDIQCVHVELTSVYEDEFNFDVQFSLQYIFSRSESISDHNNRTVGHYKLTNDNDLRATILNFHCKLFRTLWPTKSEHGRLVC